MGIQRYAVLTTEEPYGYEEPIIIGWRQKEKYTDTRVL